jgi:hypothetical protein
MPTAKTMATAIIAATSVVALYGAAVAQTSGARIPSASDIETCNREAQLARGGSASPSTAPGTSLSSPGGGATPGTAGTTGALGSGGASAGGAVTGSTGSGTTSAAGATGGTGSVSGGSTLSSGTSPGDSSLSGMASAGSGDPAYQQAYQSCMRRRGY